MRDEVARVLRGLTGRAVVGECVRPREHDGVFRFDLCDPSGAWIPVVVGKAERARIEGFLRMSLHSFVTAGAVIAVQGDVTVVPERGSWELQARRIGARRGVGDGALFSADEETFRALSLAFVADARGRARLRLPRERLHTVGRRATDELRAHLNEQGVVPRRVIVFRPRFSETGEELRDGFARSALEVDERDLPSTPEGIAEAIRAVEDDSATLIAIHRGGGHWSSRRVFDAPEVACAIALSPIPVLTGIGHKNDVSFADRAATASTSTPTALGRLIAALAYRERRMPSAASVTAAAPVRQTVSAPPDDVAAPAPAELVRAEKGWLHQYNGRLRLLQRVALDRIRLRSRVQTTLWGAAVAACFAVALSLVGSDRTAAGIVAGCGVAALAATVVTGTARRRALRPRRRPPAGAEEVGSEEWFEAGYRVATPRAYRRWFFGVGRPAERR